jgi:hypothetical protein
MFLFVWLYLTAGGESTLASLPSFTHGIIKHWGGGRDHFSAQFYQGASYRTAEGPNNALEARVQVAAGGDARAHPGGKVIGRQLYLKASDVAADPEHVTSIFTNVAHALGSSSALGSHTRALNTHTAKAHSHS